MAKFSFLFSLFLLCDANLKPFERRISPKALHDVTSEIFGRHNIDFDLIMLGKSSNDVNDTINGMLEKQEVVTKIQHVKSLDEWNGRAAVVFVEPFSFSVDKNKPNSKLLFVLFTNENFNISKSAFQPPERNENYFLIASDSKYELRTFEFYTEQGCGERQFQLINTFDKSAQKWERPLDIPQKFLNFHGCPLKVFSNVIVLNTFDLIVDAGMSFIHPAIEPVIVKRDRNEKEMRRIFAEKGNFTLVEAKTRFEEGIHVKQISNIPYEELRCSYNVFRMAAQFMYSPPEPYSNYEKMILPFDDSTWFYLIAVFCSAFVGIFIINLTPKVFRDLVYGRNVNMPSFNVIGTLFGIGQTRLPDNNFGRIILMTFIIFCLIFRTAYQGVFFEMFTKEMLRNPPKTFADLKERNYTMYNVESQHFSFHVEIHIEENNRINMKYLSMLEVYDIFTRIKYPKLKAVIPTTEADMKVIKVAFSGIQILKENLYYEPYAVCVGKDSFFMNLNRKVSNALISGGIIQYWYHYFLDYELKPLIDPPKGPKVFDIEDLSFGFNVWLVACAFSIAAFVVEVCYAVVKNRTKRFIRRYTGLFYFMRFFTQGRLYL